MWRRLIVLCIAISVLAAACGGEPTEEGASDGTEPAASPGDAAGEASGGVADLLASLDGMDRDGRRAELIDMAAEEGSSVTIYTSLNTENLDELAEVFTEDTGVAILSYRAAAEDVRTRVLEEAQANRLEPDVVAIGDSRMVPLVDADLLAPYTSPYQEDLVDGAVQDFWTLIRYNLYAVAWNTDLAAEGEQPTTFEDLADPNWDGRMTMESSDADWYWSVSDYLENDQGFSEEEVAEYWEQVTDGSDFNSGHTSTNQLLIAGRYALFTSAFSRSIEQEKLDGAPVEWRPPVEPLFATPEAAAIIAQTPRPASAILLMDWLLDEGQDVMAELQIDVTRADLSDLGDAEVRFVDAYEWAEVEADVIAEYEALSGGGS
ncbi:MAG: extracellular solute-binding protein [Nitriliruptorales bacterium]|nr:extracellular solute-binding protein [Nitriliruptorales bacterium]